MRLANRVVLVTGAAGIAAAGAHRFAEEGASVFVVSLDEDECRALAAGLEKEGAVVGWAVSDLTDEEQTRAAFTACLDRFGRIDGLFAVVGASGRSWGDGPLDQIPLDGWRKTIDVNTVPPFLATREAVRSMKETGGGSIVLIGSVLATHPSSLFVTHAYAAAKGAAISLTKALASHYATDGIRVNLVSPGLVDTPMAARAAADPASVAYASAKQPLAGGLLDPADVAAAAAFFLSDDASRITGQVLEVDGGWGVTEDTP
jgi:NAD(P)-dependent dehydrogenase (short-subunit alcohol dehydrogenase family)